ncbi:MAG: hypothetical protein AAF483_03815 [Planctomycetota bacterium]
MNKSHAENLIAPRLLDLLESESPRWRTVSLNILCEGYCDSSLVAERVVAGWERWDAATAFPEFPMLSYLPMDGAQVEFYCELAQRMSADRKLTDPSTRCAGKLMEQMLRLPAKDLEPWEQLIIDTVGTSKIFFRVDLANLRDRIHLSTCRADQCAAVLNNAVEKLSENSQDMHSFHQGLAALEAIRTHHPEYIDLNAVLATPSTAEGAAAASLRLTMHSLSELAEPGTEELMGNHLLCDEEAIFTVIVEGLVRAGTREAAAVLLEKLDVADGDNRKWIARGLQRLQMRGLAAGVSACRDQCRDPYVWLMLLIAEVRQLDLDSMDRISLDLARLQSASEALLDTLGLFFQVHEKSPNTENFRSVVLDYLERIQLTASDLDLV